MQKVAVNRSINIRVDKIKSVYMITDLRDKKVMINKFGDNTTYYFT